MSNEIKHTPGPLVDHGAHIEGPDGEVVCYVTSYTTATPRQKANARRIVQCVNSHDALLAALKDCLRYLENDIGGPDFGGPEREAARAAIASAEQQSPSPSTAGDTP